MSDERRTRRSIDEFGLIISEARMRLGWSQAYLAGITGYHQYTISQIERSMVYPNSATLQDLSNALGVRFVIEPNIDL